MSRVSRLLNGSAEVWRYTRTADGMGGWVEAWARVATVRARFSQPSAAERVLAAQAGAKLTHVVFAESGADIARGDQLRNAGVVYDVLATYEPSVSGTYLRADCEVQQSAH